MAEFSAENSFVGEDWESECYDSSPCAPLVQTSGVCRPVEHKPPERDGVSEYKPGLTSSANVDLQHHDNDDNCTAAFLTDSNSGDFNSFTGRPLRTSAGDAADDKSTSAFITDSRKVFVSNVSYRVRSFVRLFVSCCMVLFAAWYVRSYQYFSTRVGLASISI